MEFSSYVNRDENHFKIEEEKLKARKAVSTVIFTKSETNLPQR